MMLEFFYRPEVNLTLNWCYLNSWNTLVGLCGERFVANRLSHGTAVLSLSYNSVQNIIYLILSV
jgi:hypothetical protein